MDGCESRTVKKAKCRRIDAFELWCWRRLLRVRWTARRSNQSILKEISPGISLEGMMLKLKLATSWEELTHWKTVWCWEGLWAGGEGDDRGQDGWMASPTWWTWVWVNSGSWWWTGRPGVLQFMGSQRVGHDWVTELNCPTFRASLISKPSFPGSSVGKESSYNSGDPGLIPGLGRSSGEGNVYSRQYSCLEHSMDKGAWWALAHGIVKSWIWLRN